MTTEAYEKRGELIRAPIRTKLGNVVMRWVRPDNANIVVERRAAVPVPEPVVVPDAPTFPESYEVLSVPVAGCCGATYLRAYRGPEKPVEWSPERIEQAWNSSWKPAYDRYVRYAEDMKKQKRFGEERYYRDSAEMYNLKRYTDQKVYLKPVGTTARVEKTPGTGSGVTISPDPFDGFMLKTPAGWYLRCDRDPVNTKTDEAVEPNEVPEFKSTSTRNDVYASAAMPFKDDNMSWCLNGMREGQHSGYSMMAACKTANIPVGAKVLAIFNQSQHNSNGTVTPRSVAAAGFRLVLKTGNHNHPGYSTLYIYERVIQKGDYDEIK